MQFLEGNQRECPNYIIYVLDMTLKESAANNCVTISKSIFSHEFGSPETVEGLEFWKGRFQSIRPLQMGLCLNVDATSTPFYKPVNVIEFVKEYLDIKSIPSTLMEIQRLKIQRALKGVQVQVTHMANVFRCYRITGITSESANQLTFIHNGQIKSVSQYFEEEYNCVIIYNSLPCLKAGSNRSPKYLPMEVCKIVSGQRYINKLNNRQVSQLLRSTCKRPIERERSILKLVKKNDYNNDEYAKAFGIAVEPFLATVHARVLPTPKLKYHNSGSVNVCQPDFGQWDMINKRVFQGGIIDAWACISFCSLSRATVWKFCRRLIYKCNNIGMGFNEYPVDISVNQQPSQIQKRLRDLHNYSVNELKLQNHKHKKLQLLIVVLPDPVKGSYGSIKRICETELGLVTQCCQQKHVVKLNNEVLANLALKINVKVGGCNTVLEDAVNHKIPIISEEPIIIFGADVTHPGSGEDSPSIAAVVASVNWPLITKYRGLVSVQPSRQEIIGDLFKTTQNPEKGNVDGGMIRELLLAFYRETNCRKPRRIIFYRDGVGESQFNALLLLELEAIRKACNSIQKNYLPPVTFVVVQKRHHVRLFPEIHGDPNTTVRSGNILPGTIVDTNICHPTEFDFYLCSHAALTGTSRPIHYQVIYDENNFSADLLQTLTYNLCYTFARCTSSVSIVPPVYYAHILASRGVHYLGEEIESEPVATVSTLPQIIGNVKEVMFYC